MQLVVVCVCDWVGQPRGVRKQQVVANSVFMLAVCLVMVYIRLSRLQFLPCSKAPIFQVVCALRSFVLDIWSLYGNISPTSTMWPLRTPLGNVPSGACGWGSQCCVTCLLCMSSAGVSFAQF